MDSKKIFSMGLVSVLIALGVFYFIFSASAANPDEASVTPGTPETWTGPTTPGNTTAEGGNITEVTLSAITQTTHWQGFWGQVSGAIALRDTSGDTMYNWTMGVTGNVYISNESSITWSGITNVSSTWCNSITGTGDDACNDTFKDGSTSFTIAGNTVPGVNITQTFDSTGAGTWDEGILNASGKMLFAATVYNNADTFQGGSADFQAIVPVNGSTTRTYFFWIELGI